MKKILNILIVTIATMYAVIAEPIEEMVICPGKTITVLKNSVHKAPASNTVCSRGTIIRANTSLDPNYPNNEPFTNIVAERVGDRYSKVTLEWKEGWTGTVSVTVFGNAKTWKGLRRGCTSDGDQPIMTYRITRKSLAPLSRLEGDEKYTLGKDGVATNVKYKGTAKRIRYKVNGKLIDEISIGIIKRIRGILDPIALPYTATATGRYTFTVEERNGCGDWFSTLSKTIDVSPSCAGDDPDKIAFGISGPDIEAPDNGYKVENGGSYTINISGVTDFDDNYTLSHNGGSAVQLSGKSFTVNSEVGSYRIEATPIAGRSGCTVLNPIKVFVGGRDRVFPAQGQFYNCPIVLPNKSLLEEELGYKTDEYQNYILEHFSLTLRSKKHIIIKPGVILESGAQLIVQGSAPQVNASDPDKNVNFIEQISYDEYRNVLSHTRAYFDERGRAVQSQYKNLTENVSIASATLYDAYGRAVINTLPAPVKSNGSEASVDDCGEVVAGQKVDFLFQPTFVQNAQGNVYDHADFDLNKEESPAPVGTQDGTLGWYYSDQNTVEKQVATTQYPYSRALYHRDGSGEMKGTALPGDYHRAGSGHVATSNTVGVGKDSYLEQYFSRRAAVTGLPALASTVGAFFKRELVDVNGYRTEVYFDQAEQALMTLYFGKQTTPLTISHQYYDHQGRLIASKDPMNLITRYHYDLRGRLVAMEEPDAGKTEYMYRKDGSIRFSQNAEQRLSTPPRFSYTHYDALGRPVASGEYAGTAILFGSKALEDQLEETLRYQPTTQSYSNDGLTKGSKRDQVLTYYDGQNPAPPYPQTFVRGSVSYSEKLAETGTPAAGDPAAGDPVSKTWYSYDVQGRVTRMVQDIAGLGQKQVQYRYGHQGSVSLVAYQQGQADAFFHHYQYDENGRLERVYVSDQSPYYDEQGEITNTDDYQLQASYAYYLHGPLKQVKLAGQEDENGQVANALQTTDYYYTVQGWLKAINNPNDTENADNDVFSMQLDYFSGDYHKQGSGIASNALSEEADYSGNIIQQQWRTTTPSSATLPGNQITGAYRYEYDKRYQLENAFFGSITNGTFTPDAQGAYSTTGLDYDKNGNILGLQRKGQGGSLLHEFQGKYQYTTGTNQLSSVSGYKSYTYNALGQMTEEVSATGSQKLTYDVSGKVTEVRNQNNALIAQYQYDDRGFRFSKQSYENGSLTKTTYYVRDASGSLLSTYEQEANQALTQTEVPVYGSGRIGLYQATDRRTEYFLTDHLGNTRAIVNRERLADGGVDVSYFADYFAFGSLMRSAGSKPRYGYQGSFAEDETEESGYVSFQLRQYDPVVGRFLIVDPERQFASPYLGMGNNPISGIDPTGGRVLDDYYIYADGTIDFVPTGQTDNFYFVDAIGNETFLGSFAKNEDGLIQLPSNFGVSAADFSFNFQVKDGNGYRSFINPDAFASLLGALITTNTTDLTIIGFSLSDGASPHPSSSHIDGLNGDIRYLRTDQTGGALLINQLAFDRVRNERLSDAFHRFGWKSQLSERTSSKHFTPNYILPKATHFSGFYNKKGEWVNSRHNNHLHLQGYNPNINIGKR